MSQAVGSGSFERGDETTYLSSPSPKRARYEDAADIAEVTEVETIETGGPNDIDHTVTITVPSTQFEIEINSQAEGSPSDDIGQIQTGDLAGPAFGIVQDPQGLGHLGEAHNDTLDVSGGSDEQGGALSAIGHALIQMQQGGGHSVPSGQQQSQIILTRATSSDSDSGQHGGGGGTPLYVMIPPASSAEILQAMGQSRPIAPKTTTTTIANDYTTVDLSNPDPNRKNREAQRKATHNEVERRRRDRINELIKILAQIVPGCQKKDTTTGNIVGYVYSKGTVLDKTVEYLRELMTQNEQLAGTAKLAEKSANALSLLQNQITVLEKENAFLRAQIIQFGIDAAASSSQPGPGRQLLNSPLAQSLLNTVAQSPQVSSAPLPITPSQASQNAAQQLLLSLAQSLTNSPLLTSLTQTATNAVSTLAAPTASSSPPLLSSSQLAAAAAAQQVTPTRLTSSPLSNPSPPPQLLQAAISGAATPPPPQAQTTSVLSSLVQTLASITNTTTSPSNNPVNKPPTLASTSPAAAPQPPQQGLSAAAAASLLNTLILAQNVLTGGSAPNGSGQQGDSSSVLGLEAIAAAAQDQNTQQ